LQITAIDAEDIGYRKIAWIRNLPGRLRAETESIIQRILQARDVEDAAENIEKRAASDACPMGVDSSHPLW
jgi:transcription elongation GreA/GreB family factor